MGLIVLVLDVGERTIGRVTEVPGIGTDNGSNSISRPNQIVPADVTT